LAFFEIVKPHVNRGLLCENHCSPIIAAAFAATVLSGDEYSFIGGLLEMSCFPYAAS
jgi:hypothetical protein